MVSLGTTTPPLSDRQEGSMDALRGVLNLFKDLDEPQNHISA